jgi:hypothetical protein
MFSSASNNKSTASYNQNQQKCLCKCSFWADSTTGHAARQGLTRLPRKGRNGCRPWFGRATLGAPAGNGPARFGPRSSPESPAAAPIKIHLSAPKKPLEISFEFGEDSPLTLFSQQNSLPFRIIEP